MSSNEVEMMKRIRLLLVEDNAADARVVERHLKDAGLNEVNCDWVQTAADAAERLQKVEYDLVLLDLGLPDAQGLQALRALRAVADLTPIIVLTGSDDYKQGLIAVREVSADGGRGAVALDYEVRLKGDPYDDIRPEDVVQYKNLLNIMRMFA